MQDRRNVLPRTARVAAAPIEDDEPTSAPAASVARGGSDAWTFLRGFVRDPKGVAAVIPSSRWLERHVVRNARAEAARCAVELGPGTGGMTRRMLSTIGPQARMLAIELEPAFHAHLRGTIEDRRLSVELGSAERLEEFLAARRLPAPDVVISGIPFSTMPAEVGDRIAAAIGRALAPGGRFVAYQWTPVVAVRTIPYLGEPRREWELWNVPPMRVFTWVKAGG
jgi:phosphatidylethanolamine/phosphatidyl-N-methylethanolamine N-methyltransferase